MSAPWGCGAENGDCTKRDKDRGENSVIHTPGEGCAKEREGGEFDKAACFLGVHFPGSAEGWAHPSPPPAAWWNWLTLFAITKRMKIFTMTLNRFTTHAARVLVGLSREEVARGNYQPAVPAPGFDVSKVRAK
jgi:hypothetical protein